MLLYARGSAIYRKRDLKEWIIGLRARVAGVSKALIEGNGSAAGLPLQVSYPLALRPRLDGKKECRPDSPSTMLWDHEQVMQARCAGTGAQMRAVILHPAIANEVLAVNSDGKVVIRALDNMLEALPRRHV